jgi:hypothetical protein
MPALRTQLRHPPRFCRQSSIAGVGGGEADTKGDLMMSGELRRLATVAAALGLLLALAPVAYAYPASKARGNGEVSRDVVSIQRLNDPVGCASLSFGAAPTPGSIGALGETDCFRFSGAAGDQVRVRLIRTAGATFAEVAEVLRPDGTTRCGVDTRDQFTCSLDAGGTHTLLVQDWRGTATGSYVVSIENASPTATADK